MKLILLCLGVLFVFVKRLETFEKYRLLYVTFILLFLGGLLSNYRKSEAIEIVKENPRQKIVFKYNSAIFQSDSINRFVGQTRNFIFLYRITDSTSHIYKLENCDSISIHEFSKR